MTARYRADTDALGLGRPDHEPLASETMGPIVAYIEALIERGHAYESDGDVYFRVRSDPDYGSLSHRRLEDMDQGEAVEGSERKRDPLDFALWKAHKEGEDTFWDVALGSRAAGLAHRVLGDGRGAARRRLRHPRRRLGPGVPPPRERGRPDARRPREELARLWMHNGMIQFTGEKMAKSVGNIAPLHEVLERYGATPWSCT